MEVRRESEVTQSCPTLRDPMDFSLPGSSIHGIFQARVLECGAIAFSIDEVDKRLNRCKLLKLTQEETDNMSRPKQQKTELVIKKQPAKKNPRPQCLRW